MRRRNSNHSASESTVVIFPPAIGQVANAMLTSLHGGPQIARKWLKTSALSLQVTSSQISHFNTSFSLLFMLPSGDLRQHVGSTPEFAGVPGASSGYLNSDGVECLLCNSWVTTTRNGYFFPRLKTWFTLRCNLCKYHLLTDKDKMGPLKWSEHHCSPGSSLSLSLSVCEFLQASPPVL